VSKESDRGASWLLPATIPQTYVQILGYIGPKCAMLVRNLAVCGGRSAELRTAS
jgi:hypothetical protein